MLDKTKIAIRQMHFDDIRKCILLSDAEHWNQTETDWSRLLYGPQNHCLVAESANQIVGTATAMNYSNIVAWIGMVLVDRDYRGRGIAKILVSSLINLLKSCKSVKLDATPAGQPVYERIGFNNEYLIHRLVKSSEFIYHEGKSKLKAESIQPSDIDGISLLDYTVFGAERTYLLSSLYKNNPDEAFCLRHDAEITAFSLGRKGRKYFQIGPVVAPGTREAKKMFMTVLEELSGEQIVVDVPEDKAELMKWLEDRGFLPLRQFYRMYLRQNPYPGRVKNYYLICGPEYG